MLLRLFPFRVRKMPFGKIRVVREGFNSSPFLHHTIETTIPHRLLIANLSSGACTH